MDTNYNIVRIQRYLEGLLSKEEMYEIEREALNDPFLNDALEGYRMQSEVNHGQLSLLQQRLAQRVEGKQEEKNRFFFTTQRLAIASVAAVLFVLAVVLLWMKATMDPSAGAAGEVEKEVFVDLNAPIEISPAFLAELNQRFQAEWSGATVRPVATDGDATAAADGDATADGTREVYLLRFDVDLSGRPQNLERMPLGTATGDGAADGAGAGAAEPVLPLEGDLDAKILKILQDGPIWEGLQGRSVELELRM